jgi:hypothetical protein
MYKYWYLLLIRGIGICQDRLRLCYLILKKLCMITLLILIKTFVSFDLCTLLVDKNTDAIVDWFRLQLGDNIRSDKRSYVGTNTEI